MDTRASRRDAATEVDRIRRPRDNSRSGALQTAGLKTAVWKPPLLAASGQPVTRNQPIGTSQIRTGVSPRATEETRLSEEGAYAAPSSAVAHIRWRRRQRSGDHMLEFVRLVR